MGDGVPPEKREMSPEWWAQNAIEAARREAAREILEHCRCNPRFPHMKWIRERFGLENGDE